MRWLRLATLGGIFTIPMFVMFIAPDTASVSTEEARTLAPAPRWPMRFDDWVKLPLQANAWLDDHFGLRDVLTHARAKIIHVWLGASSDEVLIGRHGRMFIRSNMAIEQSAGAITAVGGAGRNGEDYRSGQHAPTSAGRQAALRDRAERGDDRKTADLPDWARNSGRPTEYDALLDLLRARAVAVEDMRPALRAGLAGGSLYLHNDSHWNVIGTLIGFNVVVDVATHPDWRADQGALVALSAPVAGGDLARILGINADQSWLSHGLRWVLFIDPSI